MSKGIVDGLLTALVSGTSGNDTVIHRLYRHYNAVKAQACRENMLQSWRDTSSIRDIEKF